MNIPRLLTLVSFLILVAFVPAAWSQSTGTVEGRVSNADTGEFLELARVTVEGTPLESLTDATGRYRLTNIPAGTATIKAFRTGLAEQALSVQVTASGTVVRDFALGALRRRTPGDDTVKLDQFVVASSKAMDNAALAINTQRFAPNR
jgi:hypothetical protein